MEKMLFTSQQPIVNIVLLPNGMRDVTVLANEEFIILEPNEEEQLKQAAFQYDGNQFRTVYEVTEQEILSNIAKYLNYRSDDEPTLLELKREKEIVDSYTLELMEAGLL